MSLKNIKGLMEILWTDMTGEILENIHLKHPKLNQALQQSSKNQLTDSYTHYEQPCKIQSKDILKVRDDYNRLHKSLQRSLEEVNKHIL